MPNICIFCEEEYGYSPRVPDAEHRMMWLGDDWCEWSTACGHGEQAIVMRRNDNGSTSGPFTLNQIWEKSQAKDEQRRTASMSWKELRADVRGLHYTDDHHQRDTYPWTGAVRYGKGARL